MKEIIEESTCEYRLEIEVPHHHVNITMIMIKNNKKKHGE